MQNSQIGEYIELTLDYDKIVFPVRLCDVQYIYYMLHVPQVFSQSITKLTGE